MAVLDRPTTQKQLTSTLMLTLVLALVVFIILLLSSAAQMSTQTGITRGGIASLKLFEISRQPIAGGGFVGSVNFIGSGMAVYFSAWLTLGIIASYIRRTS